MIWAYTIGGAALQGFFHLAGAAWGTKGALGKSLLAGEAVGVGLRAVGAQSYHSSRQQYKRVAPTQALVSATLQSVKPVENEIRRTTPVDEGVLKRSTGSVATVEGSGTGVKVNVEVGWVKTPGRDIRVQRVVEGGSVRGRRPLRVKERAWQKKKREVEDALQRNLQLAVAATNERLAEMLNLDVAQTLSVLESADYFARGGFTRNDELYQAAWRKWRQTRQAFAEAGYAYGRYGHPRMKFALNPGRIFR